MDQPRKFRDLAVTNFAGKPCRSALSPEYNRFDRLAELSCEVPDLRYCSGHNIGPSVLPYWGRENT